MLPKRTNENKKVLSTKSTPVLSTARVEDHSLDALVQDSLLGESLDEKRLCYLKRQLISVEQRMVYFTKLATAQRRVLLKINEKNPELRIDQKLLDEFKFSENLSVDREQCPRKYSPPKANLMGLPKEIKENVCRIYKNCEKCSPDVSEVVNELISYYRS